MHRAATPQGVFIQCVPYGLFAHDVPVTVNLDTADKIVEIGDLQPGDRDRVVKMIEGAEKMKTSLRANNAGLQLVGPR
jgi:hypothetical protein